MLVHLLVYLDWRQTATSLLEKLPPYRARILTERPLYPPLAVSPCNLDKRQKHVHELRNVHRWVAGQISGNIEQITIMVVHLRSTR